MKRRLNLQQIPFIQGMVSVGIGIIYLKMYSYKQNYLFYIVIAIAN